MLEYSGNKTEEDLRDYVYTNGKLTPQIKDSKDRNGHTIETFKNWIHQIKSFLLKLIQETDFILVCCYENYKRTGITKSCIVALVYLIASDDIVIPSVTHLSDTCIGEKWEQIQLSK